MKVSPYVVAAALLLSGTSALVRAEPGEDGKGRWSHEGRRERMKEKLGLTDEQEGKLKSLRRAHRDATADLRAKLKSALRKLGDQLEDKAADKELAATLESISSARKALQAEHDRFESGLAGALTPTQRAKLLAARLHKGRGMMKHRFGRGGGEGGPTYGPGRRGPGAPVEDEEADD